MHKIIHDVNVFSKLGVYQHKKHRVSYNSFAQNSRLIRKDWLIIKFGVYNDRICEKQKEYGKYKPRSKVEEHKLVLAGRVVL